MGVGLYLVVERDYPAHWAWLAIVVSVAAFVAAGYAVSTATLSAEAGSVAASAFDVGTGR